MRFTSRKSWRVFDELPKEYRTEDVLIKIITRKLEETTIHELVHLLGEINEGFVRRAVYALNTQ